MKIYQKGLKSTMESKSIDKRLNQTIKNGSRCLKISNELQTDETVKMNQSLHLNSKIFI
jgi:hypothetical protein